MKKRFIGFLVLASFLLMFNTASYATETEEKTTAEVLESAWDEFGLFSFEIGQTDPVITIGMDQRKSDTKLREYLNDNLSEKSKKKYDVVIFKDDINKLKKEHQKYLQEKSRP
ncbi:MULTISPECIES: hypothetical protein [Bacillus]|uniref:hypothetical protein n=1 Tax=Bacillus TaxID=1386 RepID=UPI001ABE4835|nr:MULTISPECIES: hypothetical protein [Bacillus]MBR7817943.1 hypothetical protein [Bacillus sp. CCNWLCWHY013]MDJ0479998.1 hypothetical protein [Bacillus amyloliquefaciens]QTG87497.1 hypothetical protein J4048_21950 [Bacillus amyloliquefaciens]